MSRSPAFGSTPATGSGRAPVPNAVSLHSPSFSSTLATRAGIVRGGIDTVSCTVGAMPRHGATITFSATAKATPSGVARPLTSIAWSRPTAIDAALRISVSEAPPATIFGGGVRTST